eukprot:Colp12_sorted_trinity150504_noHs@21136
MSRPEHLAPPELFYNEDEAQKYSQNTRIIEIQNKMSQRAVELLALPEDRPCFILDIGCGSGLSGEVLSDDGHVWVGCDISPAMLDVALERETEGDLLLHDMGQGMPFRPGCFDGAISISALQWLCNADKASHVPKKRLKRFFTTLYSAMTRGSRAVFQFYPENPQQMELITSAAMQSGFSCGLVVDYPNSTKAKKIFLCLFAGAPEQLPQGLDGDEEAHTVDYAGRKGSRGRKGKKERAPVKSRKWITEKKERAKRQGKEVRENTKFTGRKRRVQF